MSNLSVTEGLAIYGAILSSIAIGWNLYRNLTDRGRLRVHCYIGNIITSGLPSDRKDYLVYSVTNIGTKPMVVTSIGGAIGDKQFMITPRSPLPKMLAPGEYFIEYTDDLSVLDRGLHFLAAWDSLGHTYKVKKRTVKDLINRDRSKLK